MPGSGSNWRPVWSTILRSPSASFGSVNQASLRQAKDAAPKRRSREGGPLRLSVSTRSWEAKTTNAPAPIVRKICHAGHQGCGISAHLNGSPAAPSRSDTSNGNVRLLDQAVNPRRPASGQRRNEVELRRPSLKCYLRAAHRLRGPPTTALCRGPPRGVSRSDPKAGTSVKTAVRNPSSSLADCPSN